MDMVTISKKEYERLKALEGIDYVADAKASVKDLKAGRTRRVF